MFEWPLDPAQGATYLILALLMPLVISIVKQSGFSRQVNSLIALVLYVVFAVVGVLVSGIALTYENLVPLAIAAAVAGRLAYSMFWSQVGGDDEGNGSIDDRLTTATSVVK